MQRGKLWLLLAAAFLVSANAWASGEDQAVYGYAWRMANFIIGISAVIDISVMAWAARDLEKNGFQVKAGFYGLILLGVIYGVAAFILNTGTASGTTTSGIGQVMQMKP